MNTRKPSIIIFLIIVFSMLLIAGINKMYPLGSEIKPTESKQTPVVVQEKCSDGLNIKIDANNLSLKDKLKFHWKITNTSKKVAHIYSSLLDDNIPAEINIDETNNTIKIIFTRFYKSDACGHYFPFTRFVTLNPNQSFEGDFTSYRQIKNLVTYKFIGERKTKGRTPITEKFLKDNFKEVKIKPGIWNVCAVIAYNNELSYGGKPAPEHSNEVVDWQKITTSDTFSFFIN